MVVDSRFRLNKFVSGVSENAIKEYNIVLIKETYFSRLMVHSQWIEEDKLKDREKENKRAKTDSFNFYQ